MTEQTFSVIGPFLDEMIRYNASDLYLTYGCPPSLRLSDSIAPLGTEPLSEENLEALLNDLLDEEQQDEFESTNELNASIGWRDHTRFRFNAYRQQKKPALVIRKINTIIPTPKSLGLPDVYSELVMLPRGLILVVGQTGSGKSTSLAAMIGHRNTYGTGHIITIEDPIEFVHNHNGCIISQRDVGIDTFSYGIALKNALRQRPDVLLIGEIRDRETMEHAINFSETGHLCLATLHANNANQAIERILSFFPEEKRAQVRLNLSLNLRAILSQRLLLGHDSKRHLASEVMINVGLIKSLIEEGKIREIKEMMLRNSTDGMRTFDQSIFELYTDGHISMDVAIGEADNAANMKLNISQYQGANRG
jgi:twitching motility protein PilU